jgi:pyruvate ferredoxin oxidoreductase delta subunit
MTHKGWNEFEIGSVLMSFDNEVEGITNIHSEDRKYSENNSFNASVAHWRVEKPIFNKDHCINCFFCWIYCPDTSILARDEAMVGVDYVHCKGCGVCVEVCPTNPKSLLMFNDHEDDGVALGNWPAKDEKKKRKG